MRPEMLPYWAIRTLWKHYSSWWNIWWCDSLSKIFVYTKTSTSYWFTSHKIHITRQFAGFTCLFFIENVWRAHLCHGCRPQCVLVSTPLYAQNILCALSTASWHTTMQSLHSRRLSSLNTEDEYTRDFTYPHKQNSSGFGHSSVETTPSVHLYLPNTRSQCNTLSVEAWYVLRVLDYLCVYHKLDYVSKPSITSWNTRNRRFNSAKHDKPRMLTTHPHKTHNNAVLASPFQPSIQSLSNCLSNQYFVCTEPTCGFYI